ncbi:MAG: MMPL family transporter [Pirellulales bacterium]
MPSWTPPRQQVVRCRWRRSPIQCHLGCVAGLSADTVDEMVDPDTRMAIVRARVRDAGSRQLETVYADIRTELDALAATRDGWQFDLSGMSVISARNIRQLITDLGGSLLLEVAVIAIILALAFRSPVAGIVSLIPNVFPLAVIAAVLVLTGRSLDPATVIVFNVCLGLAVDDTVHVMAALARNRREGVSIASAMRRAIVETGNPVVLGGLVLGVGFAAVTVSSVPSLAGFGRLACAAIAAATVAELILLPAVLVVTDDLLRRSARLGRAWKHDPIFGPAPTNRARCRHDQRPLRKQPESTHSRSALLRRLTQKALVAEQRGVQTHETYSYPDSHIGMCRLIQ